MLAMRLQQQEAQEYKRAKQHEREMRRTQVRKWTKDGNFDAKIEFFFFCPK